MTTILYKQTMIKSVATHPVLTCLENHETLVMCSYQSTRIHLRSLKSPNKVEWKPRIPLSTPLRITPLDSQVLSHKYIQPHNKLWNNVTSYSLYKFTSLVLEYPIGSSPSTMSSSKRSNKMIKTFGKGLATHQW
jgi:hypothetical protein